MVWAGLYPINAADYEALSDALEQLTLNDASVVVRARSPLRYWGVEAAGNDKKARAVGCEQPPFERLPGPCSCARIARLQVHTHRRSKPTCRCRLNSRLAVRRPKLTPAGRR